MRLPEEINEAIAGLVSRQSAYRRYQAWYDNSNTLRDLLERMPIRNYALKEALAGLSENLCPLVVDAMADRLQLDGVDGGEAQADAIGKILDRWRIDAFQGEAHRRTATQGDGYALVWALPGGDARVYWHDADEMTVVRDYDRPERLRFALKLWQVKKSLRLTIYYPDRVERYIRRSGGLVDGTTVSLGGIAARGYDTATITMPLMGGNGADWEPYTDDGPSTQRNPLGVVPVAVFNNARYRADGRSELHDAIGLQRMLNKSLVDVAVASEANGIPNRYIVGWDFDPNSEGKVTNPFDPNDPIWVLAGKPGDVALGQFNAADLVQMAEGGAGQYRAALARVTRTPLHYLGIGTGTWPSGEALKTAEAAFTAKVERRQKEYGEPWEDAIRFALMWDVEAPADLSLEAKWRDTKPRHEYEYWQGQQIQHELGKSKREIWTEEGWDKTEIDTMFADAEAESKADVEALALTATQSFNSGGQRPE